jgi:hypothetical protein
MREDKINTGNRKLDADLRGIFDAGGVKRRVEIKKAIEDHSLSQDQLFEVVPFGIYRMALAVEDGAFYEDVLEGVNEEAKPAIEKAKEIVEQHFMGILDHPALQEEEAPKTKPSSLSRTIAGIAHVPLWMGKPPHMKPMSSLEFSSADGSVLLETNCSWDDLLYLAEAITRVLACEMKSGKSLAELRQVKLPYKNRMAKRCRAVEANLSKIRERGAIYGLDFTDQSDAVDQPSVRETDVE